MLDVVKPEIERRWLIAPSAVPAEVLISKGKEITQGYFTQPTAPVAVRVRLTTLGLNKKAELTFKGAAKPGEEGVPEANVDIPYLVGAGLHRLSLASLNKRRIVKSYGDGLYWELDIFAGDLAGLVVAEIEVPYLGYPIEVPDYFGPEITGIRELSNVSCAFDPVGAKKLAMGMLVPE